MHVHESIYFYSPDKVIRSRWISRFLHGRGLRKGHHQTILSRQKCHKFWAFILMFLKEIYPDSAGLMEFGSMGEQKRRRQRRCRHQPKWTIAKAEKKLISRKGHRCLKGNEMRREVGNPSPISTWLLTFHQVHAAWCASPPSTKKLQEFKWIPEFPWKPNRMGCFPEIDNEPSPFI